MKIGIITTTNHNIGDDFIREGILYLLKESFPKKDLEFYLIHKHSPVTARKGFESIRNYKVGKLIDNILPLKATLDKVVDMDLLVQSGAPFYWCHDETHCAENEWYNQLIVKRYMKVKDRVPFLNLAVGSCQKYHYSNEDLMFCENCSKYIKEVHEMTAVTTLRDRVAKKILQNLGFDAPVIPCASLFAVNNFNIEPTKKEYIVLNVMHKGGHFEFGQKLNGDMWIKNFKEFYYSVKDRDRHIFVCHDQKELKLVKELDPKAEYFYSDNYIDYLKFYSKAKFGIVNRIHSAYPMASLGAPSLLVGTDTRAEMAREIGLDSIFVNEVNTELLINKYHELEKTYESYLAKIKEIKELAFKDYQSLLINFYKEYFYD